MSNVAKMSDYKTDSLPESGFVPLYRTINQQPWKKNPKRFSLYVHLLTEASHKAHTVTYRKTEISLLPGQLSTTLKQLAIDTGLEKIDVQRGLEQFEKLGQISRQSDGKTTIISLLKWGKFNQKIDTASDTVCDTRKPYTECGQEHRSDTGDDTGSDTQNNNGSNNNKDLNAESATQHRKFSELRRKGFEHYWKHWRDFKTSIGKSPGPKETTYDEKFSKLYPLKTIAESPTAFKADINAMCQFIVDVHNDIEQNGSDAEHSNHFKMFPALFLKNRQWREHDHE